MALEARCQGLEAGGGGSGLPGCSVGGFANQMSVAFYPIEPIESHIHWFPGWGGWGSGRAAVRDRVVEFALLGVERRGRQPWDARTWRHRDPAVVSDSSAEISPQAASTAGLSSRMIRCVDQSWACTARLTPASTRPSGAVIGPATERRP